MTPTCTKTQKGMDCTMEIDTTNYPSGTYPLELQMCNGAQCDTAETSFEVKESSAMPFFYILGIILLGIFIYIIRQKGK